MKRVFDDQYLLLPFGEEMACAPLSFPYHKLHQKICSVHLHLKQFKKKLYSKIISDSYQISLITSHLQIILKIKSSCQNYFASISLMLNIFY